ncbi:hypothetical protein LR48_Vigan01g093400 [Vigna angularis]|uniref:Uncharacterized protein n=1 Tax=Phaseolus angularis TaxID=3914 RepID=A0A0L9TMJ3_PHAAN|nr:hypothetical protein LR48_Vigan01g093400 [Vigna angularis]
MHQAVFAFPARVGCGGSRSGDGSSSRKVSKEIFHSSNSTFSETLTVPKDEHETFSLVPCEFSLLVRYKEVKDVSVDVMEGDPMIVLCDAVEKHHALMLVVTS